MKNLIKIEEVGMFALSIFLFNQIEFAWWWYPALILAPDIGMMGYIINPKVGAFTYNLFHHKGLAIFIMFIGWYFHSDWMGLTGIILFGHSSLDRFFGYGLKFADSFQNTHLGKIGQAKSD